MTTFLWVAVIVLLWVGLGLVGALVLARRGMRDRRWAFVGAVLGPMFLPIVAERGRRTTVLLERSPEVNHHPGSPRVVVGVDGSAESDEAVRLAARLFGTGDARVVLVAVADPDVAEFGDAARQQAWHELLTQRAGWWPAGGHEPVTEVLCGQPDRVLLATAEAEGSDVVVVGRRGHGLSHRLLGSVADALSRQTRIPVLLAGGSAAPSPEPAQAHGTAAGGTGRAPG